MNHKKLSLDIEIFRRRFIVKVANYIIVKIVWILRQPQEISDYRIIKEEGEMIKLSDKELKEKKESKKVKGIENPNDEPDLLDTCPPEQKRSPPSMVMNAGFGKMSSADNKLSSAKTKK